ncbi:MAG TPA: sigma 54-interacting transcriptional regulator, partial [Polyangiaceae bacterium]|nr:sigma 54-interacting transcriptional regulator [Polyangiaceae bacterium]
TLGLALSYLGELDAAERELGLATAGLVAHGSARESYRALNHAGIVAFRAGRIDDAITRYGEALALAEDAELNDFIPVGLLNLGTAEQQAGLWGSALRRYERGVSFARAMGRVDTDLTLEYNLANLYAEIGAFERAEDVLARLEPRVSAARLAHLELGIRLVSSEISLLLGQPARAEAALLAAGGHGRELFEVGLRRVDALLASHDHAAAEVLLDQLARDFSAEVVGELALGLELSRGRLEARLGRHTALGRLESARQEAHRAGLTALEATALTTLFEAAEGLGRSDDARAYRERARRLWDRVAADLPAALGQAFWRHPRRSRLNEVSSTNVAVVRGDSGDESRAYRRLLSLNRRLGSPHSLDKLLEHAVQAAVDLTEAERGFVLLVGSGVTVAASSQSYGADRGPSTSIALRALQTEEPVLTTNALEDPRFATQRSVHALKLQSVLCAPILSPEGPLGALYVDSSLQRGHFSAANRELLVAFADQLAIAIANARLREQLEHRTRELERKVLEVEAIARDQTREVERLRAIEHREQDLRHEYPQIVGRGPAMRRVLERLDRVTDSDASVLVLGESGTGKELVARALHANGPRKSAPFVGINCGALPENLLESELFGHARGAFTGALRDKVGLMQAAQGGTLFLDEIGEMPLSLQVKLLRVLQEREVRPLGALRAEPLDIRLVAATHRDLKQDVERGRFREDLYYRIAVVTVELPPMRDRLEDLPLIATQILARLAQESGRKPLSLTQDAVRKLSAHPLPGNVRELQNILTRAFVLASGSRLTARDLELDQPAERARAGAKPSTFSREEFQAQERIRMVEALQRTRWNVAAVSRMLGLSRATLHRKIKQYRLSRDSG